jgi:hypothetical protein
MPLGHNRSMGLHRALHNARQKSIREMNPPYPLSRDPAVTHAILVNKREHTHAEQCDPWCLDWLGPHCVVDVLCSACGHRVVNLPLGIPFHEDDWNATLSPTELMPCPSCERALTRTRYVEDALTKHAASFKTDDRVEFAVALLSGEAGLVGRVTSTAPLDVEHAILIEWANGTVDYELVGDLRKLPSLSNMSVQTTVSSVRGETRFGIGGKATHERGAAWRFNPSALRDAITILNDE